MPKKNCRRSLRNVYGAFYRFGLIDVPDEVKEKMKRLKNRKKSSCYAQKSTAMSIADGSGMYSSRLGRMAALSRK